MTPAPRILCIGAVLWDIIGRSASHMRQGSDVPGRITRLPGGVAMNIALAAARSGLQPVLLTAIGRDPEGEELLAACTRLGMDMSHVYRSDDLPTDRYMAVEGANGLIAAIADAHSLEAAGDKILRPLTDGTLGSARAPHDGLIALDGNLTLPLLRDIAASPAFAAARLAVAPASPGKAERLRPFLGHATATLYVNLEEAGLLCQAEFPDSAAAARALVARGAARAVVTDGGRAASDAGRHGTVSLLPPAVMVTRVTGAGDTFMAAHLAAEAAGPDPQGAMERALATAAAYVSGDNAL
ncbi:PfkB family carbohydrate kinase [Pseudooceanicola pacificus]|nr:PfkB family carbohydrate kinase [Pseudooceanicola pacificus]